MCFPLLSDIELLFSEKIELRRTSNWLNQFVELLGRHGLDLLGRECHCIDSRVSILPLKNSLLPFQLPILKGSVDVPVGLLQAEISTLVPLAVPQVPLSVATCWAVPSM